MNGEIVPAVALIAAFSLFLLVNFLSGFKLWLYWPVALIGLVTAIGRPRSALYALTWLTIVFGRFFSLQPLIINQQTYKFYLVDILLAGLIISWAAGWLGERRIKWQLPDRLALVWLVLVVVYSVISLTVWQGDRALVASSFKNYAVYPLAYFLAYNFFDRGRYLKTWLAFALSGGVTLIGFIVYGWVAGRGLWTEITPLSTVGIRLLDFSHAFYLCLLSIWLIVYMIQGAGHWLKYACAVLPFWLAGIAGSLMRHLWLALAVSLSALYWWWSKTERLAARRLIRLYLIIAAVVVLGIILWANILPFSSLGRTYESWLAPWRVRVESFANFEDTSIAWRAAVWQGIWQKYLMRPIWGLGFGQTVFIDMGGYFDYVEVRNAHNSFIAMFAQVGLGGLILWVAWLASVWRRLWLCRIRSKAGLASRYAILAIMLFCLVAFSFQPYLEANWFSIPFWLIVGAGRKIYEGALG